MVRDGSSHGEGEETSNRPKETRGGPANVRRLARSAPKSSPSRRGCRFCVRPSRGVAGRRRATVLIERRARSAGDHLDGARRYASPPGVVVGAQPRPRPPAICSLHQHISLGTGPSNPTCLGDLQRCTHQRAIINEPRARASHPRASSISVDTPLASSARGPFTCSHRPVASLTNPLLGKPVPFRALTGARAAPEPIPAAAPASASPRRESVRRRLTQPPHSCGCLFAARGNIRPPRPVPFVRRGNDANPPPRTYANPPPLTFSRRLPASRRWRPYSVHRACARASRLLASRLLASRLLASRPVRPLSRDFIAAIYHLASRLLRARSPS